MAKTKTPASQRSGKPRQNADKLERMRHSASHVLAMAVLEMFPEAKLGIGPAIRDGFYYDFELPRTLIPEDLPLLEQSMQKIIKQNFSFKDEKAKPKEAIDRLKQAGQPYKVELAEEFVRNKEPITFVTSGDFTDLCRGGHVRSTKEIGAFKLTRIAGAYWRGDEQNPQLQRIYGVAFPTKQELDDYLKRQEQAKQRDHRIIGKQLGLFTFADEVGPGLPLWMPKGTILREEIEKYAKEIEGKAGYDRVATPHIAREKLYKISGHIPYFQGEMYPPMTLDDGKYYMKAMNCPHTHLIYRAQPHSYRELPVRYAEFGSVYRYERSGTLAGLLRVRGMTQNDAHIYCSEEQVEDEFLAVMKLHQFWYEKVFGIQDFYMRLSLPADDKKKFVDMPDSWKKSIAMVRSAMKKSGLAFVEAVGEATFYGPKVDFQIKSITGREETASTNQLDFLAAEKFGLRFTDRDGREKPVYVIHRAPLGSHERFIAFLIEHFAGAFPLWLAPEQARVLPIADRHVKAAKQAVTELRNEGLRVGVDDRAESTGKKIRDAEVAKIPYMLVIGDKEAKSGAAAVRSYHRGDLGKRKTSVVARDLAKEVTDKALPGKR